MQISKKAEKAAKNLIVLIKNGDIIKDTLPNSFENYTDYYEQADLESYRKFIKTLTYADYVYAREVMYYGD